MLILKKLGLANFLMLAVCILIILISEYLFLCGDKLHGIFLGLWVPTILGVLIFIKIVSRERR